MYSLDLMLGTAVHAGWDWSCWFITEIGPIVLVLVLLFGICPALQRGLKHLISR